MTEDEVSAITGILPNGGWLLRLRPGETDSAFRLRGLAVRVTPDVVEARKRLRALIDPRRSCGAPNTSASTADGLDMCADLGEPREWAAHKRALRVGSCTALEGL